MPSKTTSAATSTTPCSSSCTATEEKPENRYSPGKCLGAQEANRHGRTRTWTYVSTSYAERQNLNIRMQNRRYTRLTNAFSKKADMLAYSIAIMFMYHNFVRIHQTLRSTPAMKAGVSTTSGQLRKWSICCRSCTTTRGRKKPG